ncbi:MAG: TIGR04282 family arsenosugar biosynthesis glycosyltransferase [Acidobacteriota bacterium]
MRDTHEGIVLCCMARYPRPGTAKSRLAAALGETAAHRLYVAMLRTTLERLAGLPGVRRCWHVAGGGAAEARRLLTDWNLEHVWEVEVQSAGDLGDRLYEAARSHLAEAGAVVFVGADSPTLPLPYLNRALLALREVPFVLGPSTDGGYYLLGLNRLEEAVFRDVPWGSPGVFEATMRRLPRNEVALLPFWYDFDAPADLRLLRAERTESFPRLAAVLPDVGFQD